MRSIRFVCLFLAIVTTFCAASNPVPFVNQPLLPSAIAPGSAGITLIVNGSGFVSGAVVNWNGTPLATTFVNQNQLTAAVPSADFAVAATALVTVSNPVPGGGVSNAVPFTVTATMAPLTFAAATYSVGDSLNSVIAADFNGDGKSDLAVVNTDGTDEVCFPGNPSGSVAVLVGNGDGTFTTKWTYSLDCIGGRPSGFTGFDVTAGDFNGDGKLDLAVTYRLAGLYSAAIFLGAGDGTFSYVGSIPPAGDGFDSLDDLRVGDFNGDGKLDFAFSYNLPGYASVAVALGNGDGTFSTSFYPDYLGVFSQTVGDFNRDGILDLAVGPAFVIEGSPTPILLGHGDGTVVAAMSQPSTGVGSPVVSGDFNDDGLLDLAFFDGSSSLTVLLGEGDGTFVEKSSQSVEQAFFLLNAADVNGDGKLDLVIENQVSSAISVLLGNGDGTFQTQLDYPVGGGPFSIAVGDFNGDGRLDLVSANGDATITVLLNTSARTTATTTSLGSSVNPSSAGQSVTFTAAVTPAGSGVATGTIAFQDGTTTLGSSPVSSGAASFSTGALTVGTHSITAVYSGDSSFAGSSSPALVQVVQGPVVMLSRTVLAFGNQTVGVVSATLGVTLTNSGNGALLISGLGIAGADHAVFAQTNNCGGSVAPGASCTISVTFKPNGKGSVAASLMIVDNASTNPQKIVLSGVGTFIQINPGSVNFGNQGVGTKSVPRTIIVSNQGVATITFTSIGTVGANATDFAQTNNCGTQLAAGASCSIAVTFKPGATGQRTGEVSIGDDAGGSPQKVGLAGIGT